MKIFDKELTKEFGVSLSNEELCSVEEECVLSIEDIDKLQLEISEDAIIIDKAIDAISKTTSQISLEEKMLATGDIDFNTLVYSEETFNATCELVGYERDSSLSIEDKNNLPSTDVKHDVDMRKAIEEKKSFIKKILEYLKKFFKMLWTKIKKVQAKIVMFTSASTKTLQHYKSLVTKSSTAWSVVGDNKLRVSQSAGCYYVISAMASGKTMGNIEQGSWSTKLLEIMMQDTTILDAAMNDVVGLTSIKKYDEKELSKLNLTADANLEFEAISKALHPLSKVLNVSKDKEALYYKGKLVGLTGTSLTMLNVIDNGSDDILNKLSSRQIKHTTFSLSFGKVLGSIGSVNEKKEMIEFIDNLISATKTYNDYVKEVDDYSKKMEKSLESIDKLAVPELTKVAQTSIKMANKVITDIAIDKRITVAKLIGSLTSVVKEHMYSYKLMAKAKVGM